MKFQTLNEVWAAGHHYANQLVAIDPADGEIRSEFYPDCDDSYNHWGELMNTVRGFNINGWTVTIKAYQHGDIS